MAIGSLPCSWKARAVHRAPPWSLRPLKFKPEVWAALSEVVKKGLRRDWERDEPESFPAQERHRCARERAREKRMVAYTLVVNAGDALCKPVQHTKQSMLSLRQPTAINLRTVKQVRSFLATEQFSLLFIELCCAEDSKLSSTVPQACLAIRVTKKDDLTNKNTIKILHKIVNTLQDGMKWKCSCWSA